MTSQVVQIEAKNLVWVGHRDPETGTWIAVCKALNLNAVGDTWAELQECANEAMALLFADLLENSELSDFLYRNGWRLRGPLPQPGVKPLFDVPADWNSNARFDELVGAGR